MSGLLKTQDRSNFSCETNCAKEARGEKLCTGVIFCIAGRLVCCVVAAPRLRRLKRNGAFSAKSRR